MAPAAPCPPQSPRRCGPCLSAYVQIRGNGQVRGLEQGTAVAGRLCGQQAHLGETCRHAGRKCPLQQRRTVTPDPRNPVLEGSSAIRPSRMCSVLTCRQVGKGRQSSGREGGRPEKTAGPAVCACSVAGRAGGHHPTSGASSRLASSCASITLLIERSVNLQAEGRRMQLRREEGNRCPSAPPPPLLGAEAAVFPQPPPVAAAAPGST